MDVKATVKSYKYNPINHMLSINILLAEPLTEAIRFPELVRLRINKWRNKRSLNANAYYWELLGKLAECLDTSTEELHRQYLTQDYGTFDYVDDEPIQIKTKPYVDVDKLGYFRWIGEDNGDFVWMKCKGSSEMDSKEFSRLLNGVIYECQLQGIETMTPDELARLEGYVKEYYPE